MQRRLLLELVITSMAGASMARSATAKSLLQQGFPPWNHIMQDLPQPVDQSKLIFFSQNEFTLVSAIFNRLIPADEVSINATDAGCVTFTDAQLAGSFGQATFSYKLGSFKPGTPEQGSQTALTPAEYYRRGIITLQSYAQKILANNFENLVAQEQDNFLQAMEAGEFVFADLEINAQVLFNLFLQNVMEGFFADPVYGGNKEMVGWKMIGFPGAYYDFRPYLDQFENGETILLKPMSIISHQS